MGVASERVAPLPQGSAAGSRARAPRASCCRPRQGRAAAQQAAAGPHAHARGCEHASTLGVSQCECEQ
jgi:hypothetical protein